MDPGKHTIEAEPRGRDTAPPSEPGPQGLTAQEATQRLARYGPNELEEERRNIVLEILGYFWGPIPWMIEAAVILSAIVGDWTDFGIILVLLFANAAVGFLEEHQAANAIDALKKRLAPQARVKRDGRWTIKPAREIVPGDWIRMRAGDIIPADARIGGSDSVEVNQAALTGESLPVSRGPDDTVYSGSIVTQGEAEAAVTATGQKTYFGKTAQLVEKAHAVGHFERAVLRIADYLIVIAIALVSLIVVVALFRGDRLVTTLQFALILAVAAIPVAMPTVLAVTMAVGARKLAAKEAIVSRLASIEEMAGLDMLCSDKTGTLTQNALTLGTPYAAKGVDPTEVILAGALASRAENRDPIDLAVLAGIDEDTLAEYQLEEFVPFDPVHKRTEATVTVPGGRRIRVSKGAPQVIAQLVSGDPALPDEVATAVDGFAARGYRSLGVARADADGSWAYLGVLPLYDPPRDDSKETIETARSMGVSIKMLTGDQMAISKEIAQQLGLGTNILDAASLGEGEDTGTGRLGEVIESCDGFAQVFPEHKYQIVQALQARNHIVGMTGDGVNDAPALKQADAGIAVTGATDAARAAADIVLMSPGLSVIVDAIKESRKIFQRMSSYSTYRIAETIRVLLFMTLSILIFGFYPITAVMIVLLALLNDGAILSIAYDRVRYSDEPERWNMTSVLGLASVLGIAGVIATFGLFYLGERVFHLDREFIQTLIYLKLSVAGHLTIFITRTRGHFWTRRPAPILLFAVLGTQTVATLIAVYGLFMHPIGWQWALAVWGYALAWFVVNDFIKVAAEKLLGGGPILGSATRRASMGTAQA